VKFFHSSKLNQQAESTGKFGLTMASVIAQSDRYSVGAECKPANNSVYYKSGFDPHHQLC